jgi:hypothetical protein
MFSPSWKEFAFHTTPATCGVSSSDIQAYLLNHPNLGAKSIRLLLVPRWEREMCVSWEEDDSDDEGEGGGRTMMRSQWVTLPKRVYLGRGVGRMFRMLYLVQY